MIKQIDYLIRIQRELVDSMLKNSTQGIAQAYQNIRQFYTTDGPKYFAGWYEL
jgi:hypothetical protein